MKEKKKVNIEDIVYGVNKIGRSIAKGKCSSCGGKVYKILAASEVPAGHKKKGSGRKSTRSRKSRSRKSRK